MEVFRNLPEDIVWAHVLPALPHAEFVRLVHQSLADRSFFFRFLAPAWNQRDPREWYDLSPDVLASIIMDLIGFIEMDGQYDFEVFERIHVPYLGNAQFWTQRRMHEVLDSLLAHDLLYPLQVFTDYGYDFDASVYVIQQCIYNRNRYMLDQLIIRGHNVCGLHYLQAVAVNNRYALNKMCRMVKDQPDFRQDMQALLTWIVHIFDDPFYERWEERRVFLEESYKMYQVLESISTNACGILDPKGRYRFIRPLKYLQKLFQVPKMADTIIGICTQHRMEIVDDT